MAFPLRTMIDRPLALFLTDCHFFQKNHYPVQDHKDPGLFGLNYRDSDP